MRDKIIDTIRSISESKKALNKAPSFATYYEILEVVGSQYREEIRKALNELVRSKTLSFGRTINDSYFELQKCQ
jgi:hypothetical protein